MNAISLLSKMVTESLETVQYNRLGMTDLLIHQKGFNIRSLITTQLNDFTNFLVTLHRPITREILLECLADSFNIKIIRQSCNGSDTLSSISLLYSNVNFFFRRATTLISSIFKRVYDKI